MSKPSRAGGRLPHARSPHKPRDNTPSDGFPTDDEFFKEVWTVTAPNEPLPNLKSTKRSPEMPKHRRSKPQRDEQSPNSAPSMGSVPLTEVDHQKLRTATTPNKNMTGGSTRHKSPGRDFGTSEVSLLDALPARREEDIYRESSGTMKKKMKKKRSGNSPRKKTNVESGRSDGYPTDEDEMFYENMQHAHDKPSHLDALGRRQNTQKTSKTPSPVTDPMQDPREKKKKKRRSKSSKSNTPREHHNLKSPKQSRSHATRAHVRSSVACTMVLRHDSVFREPLLLRCAPTQRAVEQVFVASPYKDARLESVQRQLEEPRCFAVPFWLPSQRAVVDTTVFLVPSERRRAFVHPIINREIRTVRLIVCQQPVMHVTMRTNESAGMLKTTQLLLPPLKSHTARTLKPVWETITPLHTAGHHVAVPYRLSVARPLLIQRIATRRHRANAIRASTLYRNSPIEHVLMERALQAQSARLSTVEKEDPQIVRRIRIEQTPMQPKVQKHRVRSRESVVHKEQRRTARTPTDRHHNRRASFPYSERSAQLDEQRDREQRQSREARERQSPMSEDAQFRRPFDPPKQVYWPHDEQKPAWPRADARPRNRRSSAESTGTSSGGNRSRSPKSIDTRKKREKKKYQDDWSSTAPRNRGTIKMRLSNEDIDHLKMRPTSAEPLESPVSRSLATTSRKVESVQDWPSSTPQTSPMSSSPAFTPDFNGKSTDFESASKASSATSILSIPTFKGKTGAREPLRSKTGSGEPLKPKSGSGETMRSKSGSGEPVKSKSGSGEPMRSKSGSNDPIKSKSGSADMIVEMDDQLQQRPRQRRHAKPPGHHHRRKLSPLTVPIPPTTVNGEVRKSPSDSIPKKFRTEKSSSSSPYNPNNHHWAQQRPQERPKEEFAPLAAKPSTDQLSIEQPKVNDPLRKYHRPHRERDRRQRNSRRKAKFGPPGHEQMENLGNVKLVGEAVKRGEIPRNPNLRQENPIVSFFRNATTPKKDRANHGNFVPKKQSRAKF